MALENISPELQELAKSCTSIDELKNLCEKMGTSLTEEELEAIAGGYPKCPQDSCVGKCANVLA